MAERTHRLGGHMEVLYECCAGLDVHKDEVVASVRVGSGRDVRREQQRFGTTTTALMGLADWLSGFSCTHVVMEATGVYWRPIWHVLEGHFELLLANAREVRNLPGRKTDMNDATWLADLLAHGLVRSSFVPPEPVQQLRDLTRTRKQLSREVAQHTLRIQKLLEDANVKLSSVLTDTLGKSGRAILEAIVNGQTDPQQLARLANSRVKANVSELAEALRGRVTQHHRFMLKLQLEQITGAEAAIAQLDQRIEAHLAPLRQAVTQLTTIPGISRVTAATLMAEIGPDMTRFATAANLVSWAGLCPRSDESAGKRRNTRTRDGNAWLKPVLVQAAWAASRKKDSYLKAQFHRIKTRRGAKKAAVAVASSLLTIAFHILRDGTAYQDLGPQHFDQRNVTRTTQRLLKRLTDLGVQVEVKSAA